MSRPVIAVIGDDAAFVDMLNGMLIDAGYHVLAALNAMHGYLLIWRQQPDLIILDMQMEQPDMGWRIVELMRRHAATQQIPVLLCSGSAQFLEQQQERLLTYQAHAIEKPFTQEAFLAKVEAMLGTDSQPAAEDHPAQQDSRTSEGAEHLAERARGDPAGRHPPESEP